MTRFKSAEREVLTFFKKENLKLGTWNVNSSTMDGYTQVLVVKHRM